VLELEKERIFSRSWLLAGHMSQLPEVGSYFTLELLGERFFFIRGDDNQIRGFYNVCRHRAHELVQGSGCKKVITCPYHAWTYELDGRLRYARNSERVPGFEPKAFGLAPVRVERFYDFLLFNLDADAPEFTSVFPDLEAEICSYVPRLDELAPAHKEGRSEASLACNWKVLLDNCIECYHCTPAHPAFVDLVDMDTYRITCHAMHTSHVAQSNNAQSAAYRYEPNDPVRHAVFWHLWPNMTLGVVPGSPNFGMFSIDPVSVGQTRTRGISLRLPTPPTELDLERDEYSARVLWPEDLGLCESVQRGLASRGYVRGGFMVGDIADGESEIATHFFQHRVSMALAVE
jgi:phenylpropionate dioxygenase-like ring-hydroxylating dioxygenase large terminal subunit